MHVLSGAFFPSLASASLKHVFDPMQARTHTHTHTHTMQLHRIVQRASDSIFIVIPLSHFRSFVRSFVRSLVRSFVQHRLWG